jgi:hypothetical protein
VQGGSGQNDSVSSTSGECSATKSVSLSFRKPIYPYGKLGVTKNDNIVVQSYGSPDYEQNAFSVWPLYTYARPINGVFGDPIATTPLENYGGGPDGEEVFDGMTTDGSHLWGSLGAGEAGGVRLFKYPQGVATHD